MTSWKPPLHPLFVHRVQTTVLAARLLLPLARFRVPHLSPRRAHDGAGRVHHTTHYLTSVAETGHHRPPIDDHLGVSINGGTPRTLDGFVRENPIKMDDDRGYPLF